MNMQKSLMTAVRNFANAQEEVDTTSSIYECSLTMALKFLEGNPEALARIATAAIEGAAQEDVDLVGSQKLKDTVSELESFIKLQK